MEHPRNLNWLSNTAAGARGRRKPLPRFDVLTNHRPELQSSSMWKPDGAVKYEVDEDLTLLAHPDS